MSNNERFRHNQFQKAVPSIPVKDCVEALGFYCDVLGFHKDFDDSILGRISDRFLQSHQDSLPDSIVAYLFSNGWKPLTLQPPR